MKSGTKGGSEGATQEEEDVRLFSKTLIQISSFHLTRITVMHRFKAYRFSGLYRFSGQKVGDGAWSHHKVH